MERYVDKSIKEYIELHGLKHSLGDELAVSEIIGTNLPYEQMYVPFRLNAFSIFITLRGEVKLNIDYLSCHVKKNTIMGLVDHHVIDSVVYSHDLRGYHLIVAKDFISEVMHSFRGLPTAPFTSRSLQPIRIIEEEDTRLLVGIIQRIENHLSRTDHLALRGLIKSELTTFMLEVMNIMAGKRKGFSRDYESSHKEEIVKGFIKLLIENCKEKHEVTFYSTELCITPEYLSRILKGFSGKTANKWIADALIAEAKIMLKRTDSTVQSVSEALYFSEQSSFSKFFKKHTGKSPLEFKRS